MQIIKGALPIGGCLGGGREEGETFEQAAIRETREETGLVVRVERLLFELEDPERKYDYRKYLTFLAVPMGGELAVGFDGQVGGMNRISELRWFPLWDESNKPAQAAPIFAKLAEGLRLSASPNLHSQAAMAFARSHNESVLFQSRAALNLLLQYKTRHAACGRGIDPGIWR